MAMPRILAVGQEPPPLPVPEEASKARVTRVNGVPGDVKQNGRFAVINRFADFALTGLTRAEICTWLLLWRDTKPDGLARTSQVDLARRAGINVRTVKRALRSLIDAGLIVIVCQGGLRNGPSTYRVCATPNEVNGGHGCHLTRGHLASPAEGTGALYPRMGPEWRPPNGAANQNGLLGDREPRHGR